MLIDVLYTVLSALPVVSHVVQLFLEPYGVSQVLAFQTCVKRVSAHALYVRSVDDIVGIDLANTGLAALAPMIIRAAG